MDDKSKTPAGAPGQDNACSQTKNSPNYNSTATVDQLFNVQVVTKAKKPCTKVMSLSENGDLLKDASQCWISRGEIETVKTCLRDYAGLISNLTSNQAIVLCNQNIGKQKLVSKQNKKQHPEAITRTREDLPWIEGPGLLLFDVDISEDYAPNSIEESIADIDTVVPGFTNAAKVIVPVPVPIFHPQMVKKSLGKAHGISTCLSMT